MARSKAYLFGGVVIRWTCDPSLLGPDVARLLPHLPAGDVPQAKMKENIKKTKVTFFIFDPLLNKLFYYSIL